MPGVDNLDSLAATIVGQIKELKRQLKDLSVSSPSSRVSSGATAQRPALTVGAIYVDTTLGFPVWCDGTNWRKFSDNSVA